VEITTFSAADEPAVAPPDNPLDDVDVQNAEEDEASPAPVQAKPKVSMSLGGSKPKYVNPLMAKKSTNPLSNKKEKLAPVESEKKMSNAERIMREELERKRKAEERGGPTWKKART
jgi:DNA/RNA-binding protein KIN17